MEMDNNGKFAWTRPPGMALPLFEQFTSQTENAVGAENTDLLAEIDAALNSSAPDPKWLDATKESAEELFLARAAAKGFASGEETQKEKARFFSHLAVMHEITYRKTYGPEMWERKAAAVPCPDFLPPTPFQVPQRRMGAYNFFNRLWNLALIFTVTGLFPMVVLPVCGVSFFDNRKITFTAVCFFAFWAVSFTIFAAGRIVCSRLRGQVPRNAKEK